MSPQHVVLVDDYVGLSDDGDNWGPAIEAALLDNPGCHVLFSPGEYVVRTSVEVPSGMLIGAGRGATTIIADFDAANQNLVSWVGETERDGQGRPVGGAGHRGREA